MFGLDHANGEVELYPRPRLGSGSGSHHRLSATGYGTMNAKAITQFEPPFAPELCPSLAIVIGGFNQGIRLSGNAPERGAEIGARAQLQWRPCNDLPPAASPVRVTP